MTSRGAIIPAGRIESSILLIRGQKVMLDSDLAALYGVTTKRLNEQVKRNLERFPEDFMFRLTAEETGALRSQFATSKGRGGRRYAPYAFTEHGAIMAASVLNSPQAVKVGIYVVRAFVKLREMLSAHSQFAAKLSQLERQLAEHDRQIIALVQAIRKLTAPPPEPGRKSIGFLSEGDESPRTRRRARRSSRR